MVVGLCGNDMTITRGLGHEYSHASTHVVEELLAGAERDLADVGAGEQRAVDVDRVARATAPARRRPAAAAPTSGGENPSLAPMVLITSVSGSSSTPKRRMVVARRPPRAAWGCPATPSSGGSAVVGRLGQLLDGDLRRRQVGVAEAEVDDVGTVASSLRPSARR